MQSIADGGTSPYYLIEAPSGVITAFNYNDTYKATNTNLVKIGGTDYADLASWGIGGNGNFETDPKFVDPANSDLHIKSSATGASFHSGEWPPLTAASGTWTADSDLSPNVDTGDPAATYSLEQPDNGSRLNIGAYGNTLQATKTAILVGIWTGAVDTIWNVPNNWSDAIVPTGSCVTGPGSNATIPDVSTASNNFPYISNIAEVEDLTIEANSHLDILQNAGLTVCGTLVNNGGTAGIVINSNTFGDGSLIHSTAGINATIYRYLRGTQFHYISSPISNANTGSIGIQGGTNGVQLYGWDASMQWNGMGASPPSTIDYAPWNPSTPVSGALTVGKGYAYFYSESTLSYLGTLNVADETINLRMNAGGAADDQGWNFIGNPFSATIDWDNVTKPNQSEMESAIYLFKDDDGTGSRSNYQYYVPSGGSGGTYGVGTSNANKNIPVGQGFFVKSKQDNLSLTLQASSRIHSSQSFYKKDYSNLLRISVNSLENNFEDELIVRFIDDGNVSFDALYDARKIFPSNPEIPQFFAISSDQIKLAINSMPELNSSFEVALGFVCLSGDFSININDFNFGDNIRVYIEDISQQQNVLLNKKTTYNFHHTGGFITNRFKLHFVYNTPPYVNAEIKDQNIVENSPYFFKISNEIFKDDDFADELSYHAQLSSGEQLPAGLIFDGNDKIFNWKKPVEGEYNVQVTVRDLCGLKVSDEFNLIVKGTGTNVSNISNDGIYIYPNPSNGIFNLNSVYPIKEIKIVDITGKIVYKNSDIKTNKATIKTSNLNEGVYTIRVRTNSQLLLKKLIIK